MELNRVLVELGLSLGESKIYLALLRSGTSSVNEIKNIVKLHRPNIYDYLEKLIDKGLVNYITKNNVKHFTAVDPEKLVEYVEEKESLAKHYLSEFRKIQNKPQEEIKVEVYKGREGIKTLFNDLIRVRKNYVAFGVDESMWEEKFSILIKQHFKKEKKTKIKARILTSKIAKIIYKHRNYRFIDHKYFSENSTVIYGDRVCTIIWDPLTVIIITNPKNAETQRKHFELLWISAESKPKKTVKVIE